MQFERKVAKSILVAANVHQMPFANLPFLSEIENDPSVTINQLKLGAFGVTPEIGFM